MTVKTGCQCEECLKLPEGFSHESCCAVHNEPAMPKGKCDCGLRYTRHTLHLCDTCIYTVPECEPVEVEFGDGLGNDNVIACSQYKNVQDE